MTESLVEAPGFRLTPYSFSRRKTRVVMVGSVAVGGENPIRVQSMTTTDTMNTETTVAQVMRLAEAGCEIARITAPTALDARNLENIKAELLRRGCAIPLVADIHFRPDAAMIAADFVEKVRINPGNYVDGKAFRVREYTDEQYRAELDRIEEAFTPLVLKLKRLGRALRIGTNHGSLSDRIMNRYGDTPDGMVESALEYIRLCAKNDFHAIIVSMKASNPRVMIAAYRLLAARMAEEGMDYPFHLGVTEAGDGPDGRIKSAAGIGSLLEDGIGDTIRVSLTEEPEAEIPVAREIAERYNALRAVRIAPAGFSELPYGDNPAAPSRRQADTVMAGPIAIGGAAPIRIVSRHDGAPSSVEHVIALLEERLKTDAPPEILEIPYRPGMEQDFERFREGLSRETRRLGLWVAFDAGALPAKIGLSPDGFAYRAAKTVDEHEVGALMEACRASGAALVLRAAAVDTLLALIDRLRSGRVPLIAALEGEEAETVHAVRYLAARLREKNLRVPILLSARRDSLSTAAVFGSLICDGIGDAVSVSEEALDSAHLDFAYNLLQACGNRITKTEFVSCPSCGRTLFDLQSTTERIKAKTGHLKGVKIAIMGCIVNGPGEMADADFGYVGGGPGKINLYVGKTCVEKSIPSEIADEKLIELIRSHGKWIDPPQ